MSVYHSPIGAGWAISTAMVHKLDPSIGDVWDYCEGGRYTVVGFVREFGGERDYVLCEGPAGQRIWPRDRWLHLVPYHGADAPCGAMVRPFTLVRKALAPAPAPDKGPVVRQAEEAILRQRGGLSHP